MPVSDAVFRLLGLSGSIRQDSANTTILRTLGQRLDGGASLIVFPLDDVPLYNSDLEGERLPDPVRALKDAIAPSRRCEFGDSERSRSSDLKREYSVDLRERVGGYTGYVVLSLVGMKPPPSSQLQPQRPLPIFSG